MKELNQQKDRNLNMVLTWTEAQARWGKEIERQIRQSIVSTGLLEEMIAYHLKSGGKRLRAILPVWVCSNLGCANEEDALSLGVALELLHNATLVHDDLQDGDVFRRGAATVWARWGMAQAVNVGDALVLEGFARLSKARAVKEIVHEVSSALIRVVEGQTMEFQLKAWNKTNAVRQSLDTWASIAARKTGGLFAACLRLGAIVAGSGPEMTEAAGAYGTKLGILFQLQDDYLDLVGDKGRRMRGRDIVECKPSFPVLWAYEKAKPELATALRRIIELPAERKTSDVVQDALHLLAACGALTATAQSLVAVLESVKVDPMAELVPGLAANLVAPVDMALTRSEEDDTIDPALKAQSHIIDPGTANLNANIARPLSRQDRTVENDATAYDVVGSSIS